MGVAPELVSLIRDVTYKCRSRVRINGGYSRPFTLARGVRQGDPLSCLLYDFAIEPLGMRLRRAISGLSALSLPPVKLTMYADDTNLFVSAREDLPAIGSCLADTSRTIGSKFNLEKTDILPVGSPAHVSATHSLDAVFPSAFVLPPRSPPPLPRILAGSPHPRHPPCGPNSAPIT